MKQVHPTVMPSSGVCFN